MGRIVRLFGLLTIIVAGGITLARRQDSSAWIAFASNQDGESAIYLMTAAGRSLRRISPENICGNYPQWSPDGQWITFWADPNCSDTSDMVMFRTNGSMVHHMNIEGHYITGYQWSPDSTKLVMQNETSDIYLSERDEFRVRLFAEGYVFPQWSPDGDWIYRVVAS